ncbi:MAG TPA: allophanate hydrolase [Polyangiaceae bacterium]|nr:allophanate hydrolase [Polyangiaceae bacterium]
MRASARTPPLYFASLRRAYLERTTTPSAVIDAVLSAIAADPTEGIWIQRQEADVLRAEARSLEARFAPDALPPLYGVPFGVKDSIDVAGVATTVACPDFARVASASAPVVDRLRAAGALYVGKTNLDQFATGLVGVRSPYGIPPNPFDPRYVTGGSSSGSAAAVARGHVAFALATDTAGSGRVPAAFNNVVGLKPSRGLLSTTGLVPACRSIDCMTVVSLTCSDARTVAAAATAFDPADPFSRRDATGYPWWSTALRRDVRVAVPRSEDLVFADPAARRAFERACEKLEGLGFAAEPVDVRPFFEAGDLLYGGPWIAERFAAFEPFLEAHPGSVLPVIATILADGARPRAADAFRAIHRLAELKRAIEPMWKRCAALVVPTAPAHPTIADALADPLAQNARLGRYTTFGNLLDLAGVAVPSGFREDGLPAGVSFLGPWGSDALLLDLASAFHTAAGVPLGATDWPLPAEDEAPRPLPLEHVVIAVVGAHLSGQPLNGQLVDRGAHLVRATRTAPLYRLFALAGTHPSKPGLLRVDDGGASIEVETWAMPVTAVGSFMAGVGPPLSIGTVELEDGSRVLGFLCEAYAAAGAADITVYGGWRAYLRAK